MRILVYNALKLIALTWKFFLLLIPASCNLYTFHFFSGQRSPHTTIMQRMSDMLTRWLDGSLRNTEEGEQPSASSAEIPSSSNLTDAMAASAATPSAPANPPEGSSKDTGNIMDSMSGDMTPAMDTTPGSSTTVLTQQTGQHESAAEANPLPIEDSCSTLAAKGDTNSTVQSAVQPHSELRPEPSCSFEDPSTISIPSTSSTGDLVASLPHYTSPNPSVPSISSECSGFSGINSNVRTKVRLNSATDKSNIQESTASHVPLDSEHHQPAEQSSSRQCNIIDESCSTIKDRSDPQANSLNESQLKESLPTVSSRQMQTSSSPAQTGTTHEPSITPEDITSTPPAPHLAHQPLASTSVASLPPLQSYLPPVRIEPVISLHYETEGTSSSTIRVGFAAFENLEAGILERSAENASLSQLGTSGMPGQLTMPANENPAHTSMEIEKETPASSTNESNKSAANCKSSSSSSPSLSSGFLDNRSQGISESDPLPPPAPLLDSEGLKTERNESNCDQAAESGRRQPNEVVAIEESAHSSGTRIDTSSAFCSVGPRRKGKGSKSTVASGGKKESEKVSNTWS